MPYVVGKECLSCKSTVCVDVCPVDAIINPEEYSGENHDVITLNSELSKTSPVIFKSVTAQ